MRMFGTLLSRLFYHYLFDWRLPQSGRIKADMERFQWLSPEEIRAWQWKRLKELLDYAYEQSPFYRRRWEECGVRPESIKTPEDFQKLPLLTREDVQNHAEEMLTTQEGIVANQTGGSTGTPLHFFQGPRYHQTAQAARVVATEMTGYRFGDKVLMLWGSDFDSKKRDSLKFRLAERLGHRRRFFNTFHLGPQDIEEIAKVLKQWRPELVVGYASSLLFVAQEILRLKIDVPRPRIGVQSSAETLFPKNRRIIEEAFGAPVFDRYGSREFATLAHECPAHEGLHVLAYSNYLEFLQQGAPVEPGEEGEIVVTCLDNWAMPFIRYQTQDLAVPLAEPCSCGRGLPLMRIGQGRVADNIVSPSGKVIHGEFFTHLFYKFEGIRRFQVVQTTPEKLTIRLVPMPEADLERAKAFLQKTIAEHADAAFQVDFEICEDILPSASGKYRFIISERLGGRREKRESVELPGKSGFDL